MSIDDVSTLLPLNSLVFQILLILADGDLHGYSLGKKLEALRLGANRPAGLYALLKQMLADGWITEADPPNSPDTRRRYYRLTPRGRVIAKAEAVRLQELVKIAMAHKLLASWQP